MDFFEGIIDACDILVDVLNVSYHWCKVEFKVLDYWVSVGGFRGRGGGIIVSHGNFREISLSLNL